MAQPTPYNRKANFSNFEALNPTATKPGADLDSELNAVKVTSDQTLANLALIQRDDGALKNGSVGRDQLSASLSVGFTLRGPWALTTNYVASDGVTYNSKFYRALLANLSTNLNRPDVSSATWEQVADFTTISADAAASADAARASADAARTSQNAAASSASAADTSAKAASTSETNAAASATKAATLIGGTVTEAVRHDVAQGLSGAQQLQARQNVGITAAGSAVATAADAAAQRTSLGLAAVAASGSATDLTTGTLLDARLSSDVRQGTAKAWSNLNGTGAIGFRDSFNISAAIDNGTGNYSYTLASAVSWGNNALACLQGDPSAVAIASGVIDNMTAKNYQTVIHTAASGNAVLDVSCIMATLTGDPA